MSFYILGNGQTFSSLTARSGGLPRGGELDQFIRCEAGVGKAILDDAEHEIRDGFVIVVPAGIKHNIINASADEPLKLYTLYSPPNHKDGTVHTTKKDAETDESEHFDGRTTEQL